MNNAFDKYKVTLPQMELGEFERVDMEKIITYHVGKIVPRVLKELDVYIDKKKNFTSRQTSLLIKGKKRKKGKL